MPVDTIASITERVVTRKSDGRQFKLYDVKTASGAEYTANREVAEKAWPLMGQPVDMDVSTKQNGNFINHYLNAVMPIGNGQATPFPETFSAPQTTPDFNPVPVVTQPTPATQTASSGVAGPQPYATGLATDKDEVIWRQTATKVAVHLGSDRGEFWRNVQTLISFYRTGLVPTDPGFGEGDDGIPF